MHDSNRQAHRILVLTVMSISAVTCLMTLAARAVESNDGKLTGEQRVAAKRSLEEFNDLIGGWRGVGQPQRSSTKGAWTETAEWVWELSKDTVGIRWNVKGGKQLTSALLSYSPDKKRYELTAKSPTGDERRYAGKMEEHSRLTLESEPDQDGAVHQVVITRLNEKRTLVLFQSRKKQQVQFARVAEIGYTRDGTKLAEQGADGPVCIVTGGKGTIRVAYKNKEYWVCCTGCRDAFLDDPESILAEAKERAAKKK